MGSKQAILPFLLAQLRQVQFDVCLDAFSGSACVAYALKRAGKRVVANDFLRFCFHNARATVENSTVTLTNDDISLLLSNHPSAGTFVTDTFRSLYFNEDDCLFLDNTWANIQTFRSRYKRSLALSALCRACMKKRPRGIFTFVGRKGWDGRRDLSMTMRDQFLAAIKLLNSCVFSNGRSNRATCLDVFETSTEGIDLVYVDTPYISPHSDCDYTRRYHFVEGLCSYWRDADIQDHTITKKIRSRPTAFKTIASAHNAFSRLFDHFKRCKIAVSYGSNAAPSKAEMLRLLSQIWHNVTVAEVPHKYCAGNQGHKVGNNNNEVLEYLFIAQ